MIQTALACPADMPRKHSVKLSEEEQVRLIRAIESAIEVTRQDQFQAWMSGPFRALLPHETVVCLELGEGAAAQQVGCLHHNLINAETMNFLCHPERGLAVRLARSCREGTQPSSVADANDISALLATDAGPPPDSPQNAVIRQIQLLSGTAYSFVLVNVPEDQVDRCRHLLKLLSSHMKMALSRAIPPQEAKTAGPLTQRELGILRWMSEGKSNREISAILGINPMTLKHHIAKVYRKLDVQSRDEAISAATGRLPSP